MRPSWDVLAVVAAGGALGSLARWGLGGVWPFEAGESLPWGTLTANVAGSVLLGVVMVIVVEVRPWSRLARPFWGAGVCGGFTTFSTYVLDIHQLLGAGRVEAAWAYLLGSVVAGMLGIVSGMALARRLARVRRS